MFVIALAALAVTCATVTSEAAGPSGLLQAGEGPLGLRSCAGHEKCVRLLDCPSLRRVAAAGAFMTDEDKATLRAAQCGWESGKDAAQAMPEVCCPLLPLYECGNYEDDKMFFSTDVNVFEVPWLARLAYRAGNGSVEYGCSASLVSNVFLVTAAHCVLPRVPDSVRLGELDTETDQDCVDRWSGRECAAPVLDVAVAGVTAHPNYVEGDARQLNDIALVRLQRAVSFSNDVRPVCLPVAGVLDAVRDRRHPSVVQGWGTQAGNGSATRLMKKAEQMEVSQEVCEAKFAQSSRRIDARLQMCTVPKWNDAFQACRGDPGGSLTDVIVRAGKDPWGVWTLVGVLSFGRGACADWQVPTVFTRVAPFMPWILEQFSGSGSLH